MIPEMTHPMGQHWRQPSRDEILVDDTHAVMHQWAFAVLHDYSATMPSGVYPGKMWKRFDGLYANQAALLAGVPDEKLTPPNWLLCWYGPAPDPIHCSVNTRRILIV